MGATILNLTERPLTQKVSFGDEPISNTIWGLNTAYRTEFRFLPAWLTFCLLSILTRFQVYFSRENLRTLYPVIPGHSARAGVSYIDDFEATKTTIDLKTPSAWVISSTPEGQPMFPESCSDQ
jgi:cell surface protein SprA